MTKNLGVQVLSHEKKGEEKNQLQNAHEKVMSVCVFV